MEHLAESLAAVPGVVAVTLGGSRATDTAIDGSDWDFGLYYRGGLDPADIVALGWPGRVFAPGEWGRLVNGGAWLTVDGTKVDLIYRDLDAVMFWTAAAEDGEFEIDREVGYVAGIATYVLAGELALGRVLAGDLPRPAHHCTRSALRAIGSNRLAAVTSLRALFIGGTGTISSACVQRALETGIEVTILNRGVSDALPAHQDAKLLTADVHDVAAVRDALGRQSFDVVVDFIAFLPTHVRDDINLFTGITGQYVFISSASAYQTPPVRLPVTESTPLRNPEWQYSRDKIACEDELVRAYREDGFPMTIVRPSHTYARTSVPLIGGRTALQRMRKGLPVVVHGDGTSLWTLTHHRDFAKAFTGLLGNPQAIGDSFHITNDEWLSWNQIYATFGAALGVQPRLVHVPSRVIAKKMPDFGPGLLGDKAHSMIFDNSKVKSVVPGFNATIPLAQGAREIVEWNAAQPEDFGVDQSVNAGFDLLADLYP